MIKRCLLTGLGAVILGASTIIASDATEIVLKDNTTKSSFSVKEKTDKTTIAHFSGNGNVGIGTVNPESKLDVRGRVVLETGGDPVIYGGTGSAELNRYLRLLNSPGMSTALGLKTGGLLVSDSFVFANPSKNDLIVKGNVGIGTVSPESKLDVRGHIVLETGGNPVIFGGTGPTELNRYLSLLNSPGMSTALGLKTGGLLVSDTFAFANPDKNDLIVKGNVGIGTAVPGFVQSNQGGLHIGSSVTSGQAAIRLDNLNGEWAQLNRWTNRLELLSSDGFRFAVNGVVSNNAMTIASNKNVGIGTTSPASTLDVVGEVRSNGTKLTSDIRFKKDIVPLKGALEKVNNLQGVSFNWRTNDFKKRNFSNRPNIGIIAQEVEEVVPEVVHTDQNGYKSVEYSKLVPLLIEAIKEQQETISALSAKVKTLEDRI